MFVRHLRLLVRFSTLIAIAAANGQAQTGCPPVSFQLAVTANPTPSSTSHIVLLRQSDGSYTAYEMTNASPYRIIRTTPNYQNLSTACLPKEPSLAPLPPPTGSGNTLGAPSQPQAFARLSSGNYLFVNPDPSISTSVVALFDPALNLISEAQLPVPVGAPALVDINGDGNLDLVGVQRNRIWQRG